jgi:hypothetical protein
LRASPPYQTSPSPHEIPHVYTTRRQPPPSPCAINHRHPLPPPHRTWRTPPPHLPLSAWHRVRPIPHFLFLSPSVIRASPKPLPCFFSSAPSLPRQSRVHDSSAFPLASCPSSIVEGRCFHRIWIKMPPTSSCSVSAATLDSLHRLSDGSPSTVPPSDARVVSVHRRPSHRRHPHRAPSR